MDTRTAAPPHPPSPHPPTSADLATGAGPDPAEMPLERLEAELCIWSANLAAAEYRWFVLLAEFDRREGWQQWGCPSCAFWMCWQLGLDSRTAREKLRVAHALVGLPRLAEQMRLGRLPYSKVRAVTRIAEPANEEGLVNIALSATTAQVERVVAAYRRALPPAPPGGAPGAASPGDGATTGDGAATPADAAAAAVAADAARRAARGLHHRRNDDGTVTLTVTLPATEAMEVLAAVDHFTVPAAVEADWERPSQAARRADAVVAMAGAAMAVTDEQLAAGRARYLVHLHTGEEQQEAHPEGPGEGLLAGVDDTTAERMCCDADTEVVMHDADGRVTDVSARRSVVRGRLRRLVQQRDRTCQVPGCTHRARKEVHHLRHRSQGGTNDPDNLVLVCSYHHHRLHEGGWSATRLADGTVQFTLPNGRVIPAEPVVVDGDAAAVGAMTRTAEDGRCKWVGDRMDLDWTLMTLFSQTPWHDPWLSAWLTRHGWGGSAEPPNSN